MGAGWGEEVEEAEDVAVLLWGGADGGAEGGGGSVDGAGGVVGVEG